MAKGKKKLLGGNRGAWAHAKEQAKGKKNPEAYAAKIYANITKKSWGDFSADGLAKAEGSRGGHIIGHTRSGKPIYAVVGMAGPGSFHSSTMGFSSDDHKDAASIHHQLASSGAPYAFNHRKTAAQHAAVAEGMVAAGFGAGRVKTARDHDKVSRIHSATANHYLSLGAQLQGSSNPERQSRAQDYKEQGSKHLDLADAHAGIAETMRRARRKELTQQRKQQINKSTASILQDFIGKSQHGEGARGGHIIGHTRSGKPIYASPSGKSGAEQKEHFKGWSAHDHAEAIHQLMDHDRRLNHEQNGLGFHGIYPGSPAFEAHREASQQAGHAFAEHMALRSQGRKENPLARNILGQTKSGKPIVYSTDYKQEADARDLHDAHDSYKYWKKEGDTERTSEALKRRESAFNRMQRHFSGFNADDHEDAARAHLAAMKGSAEGGRKFERHKTMKNAHVAAVRHIDPDRKL